MRTRASLFRAAAVVLLLATLIASWAMFDETAVSPLAPADVSAPIIQQAARSAAEAQPPVREPAALHGATVAVTVTDAEGKPLEAEVQYRGGRARVVGESRLPADIGEVTVSSPGHQSAKVHIANADVAVSLARAVSIAGKVTDAATGSPLVVTLSLRPADEQRVVAICETDADGLFRFPNLSPGQYLIDGDLGGYLSVCAGSASESQGLPVTLASADVFAPVLMYPVYVASYALVNATNLEERVFAGLVVALVRSAPGTEVPPFFAGKVETAVRDNARRMGVAYPMVRMRAMHSSQQAFVTVETFVGATRCNTYQVAMRPLVDGLRDNAPEPLPVHGSWQTSEVDLETPAPLALSMQRVSAATIAVDAGVTRLRLPHGSYHLRSPTLRSLLRRDEWEHTFEVPRDLRVVVPADKEYGVLQVNRSKAWRDQVLFLAGADNHIALWPHGSFPQTFHVSPGDYTFTLRATADGPVSWQRVVRVANRERVAVNVGED